MVGWSPDSRLVYYAIPGADYDEPFLLRSVDVRSGVTQEVLTLENSSPKNPIPEVSPDGKWVAYWGAGLYIQALDGKSPARLLIDNPGMGVGITGMVWEMHTHILGISLIGPEPQDKEIILLQPFGCEAFRLPGLAGELEGLSIP